MDGFGLFDALIVIAGLYLIYNAYMMKSTGKITNNALVSKNIDISRAKDVKGFIDCMYAKTIFVGVITTASGALDFANEKLWHIPYFIVGFTAVYLVCIVYYGYVLAKAQKKYLSPR